MQGDLKPTSATAYSVPATVAVTVAAVRAAARGLRGERGGGRRRASGGQAMATMTLMSCLVGDGFNEVP